MGFYDVIKRLCTDKGVSMRKMVTEIGLSEAVSVKWRDGGNPSAKTLKAVADYFGTTPKALLAATEGDSAVILEPSLPSDGRIFKLEREIDWLKAVVESQQRIIESQQETIQKMAVDGKKSEKHGAVDISASYNLK
jgi:transcriptional regulator with XRE-family HTH domain